MWNYARSYNQLHDMLFFINKHIDSVKIEDMDFIKNMTIRVNKRQKITPKQFRKVRFIFMTIEY